MTTPSRYPSSNPSGKFYYDDDRASDASSSVAGSDRFHDEESSSAHVSVSADDSIEAQVVPQAYFEEAQFPVPSRKKSRHRPKTHSFTTASMMENAQSNRGMDYEQSLYPPSKGEGDMEKDVVELDDVTSSRDGNRSWKWRILIAIILGLVAICGVTIGILWSQAFSKEENVASSTTDTNNSGNNVPDNVPTTPMGRPTTTSPPTLAPVTTAPTVAPTEVVPTAAPTSEIYHFLKPRLPDGGFSLIFSNSYQTKALEWTEANHEPDQHDSVRLIQRFVLACIRFATNQVETPYTRSVYGPGGLFEGWVQATGWLTDPNECNWHGITCNDQGLVEEIDLSSNRLTGSFPPETSLLRDSLVRLVLFNNDVYNYGDAGNNWVGSLYKLQELDLSETSFHYPGIPPAFGQLEQLRIMDISYSLFFGPIPDEAFQNLKKLEYVSMGGNAYNSTLPPSIGNLTSLLYFYADNCDLRGDLSMWTKPQQVPSLVELWIDMNENLIGNIPSELGQYPKLASLSLTELGINGNIPTELGALPNMKQMWLFGNKLEGPIPPHFANLTRLDRLKLEANELTGAMPSEICNKVFPRGIIEVLEADCSEADRKVLCEFPACCTCCGASCKAQAGNDGRLPPGIGGGTRRGRRRLSELQMKSNEDRRQRRHQERRARASRRRENREEEDNHRRRRLAFHAHQTSASNNHVSI